MWWIHRNTLAWVQMVYQQRDADIEGLRATADTTVCSYLIKVFTLKREDSAFFIIKIHATQCSGVLHWCIFNTPWTIVEVYGTNKRNHFLNSMTLQWVDAIRKSLHTGDKAKNIIKRPKFFLALRWNTDSGTPPKTTVSTVTLFIAESTKLKCKEKNNRRKQQWSFS